jgi:thiol:disulfide interchange protein DsbC
MLKKTICSLLILLVSNASYSLTLDNKTATSDVVQKSINATFDSAALKVQLTTTLGLEIKQVNASPMPGLVEVITNQGLFYASYDGKYFIQGKMFGLGTEVTNYTEESLAKVRVDGMTAFTNDMIIFPAKDEKHVVTVFTDITCGYCRKFHDQIDDYNDKGITVRYMAYPRSGVKDRMGQLSKGFKDLRSIWCHENPKEALTKAKSGSSVAQRICNKPIEDEFNFGRQIGVSGTPAIVFSNGMMIPGYQPPDKLAQILESL